MGIQMNSDLKKNHLQDESSPYLRQHVHNPVDWYPWGEEAFEKARTENKPVFLSIGYSTCHWCHVMAHESFEDHEVAEKMNDVFVNIKVDREERPDIDGVYMHVAQMMTSRGGWPLTIIMTPEKEPFFAATYLPKKTRYNSIGLLDLTDRIRDLWMKEQENIKEVVGRVRDALSGTSGDRSGEQLDLAAVDAGVGELSRRYDEVRGGFSNAPKFPTPHNLLLLMRHWKRTGNERSLDMVLNTLREMRKGGIYDQIGYGFHRYSTDAAWLLPHFEKMLYDQAGLMMAYTEAFQITREAIFADTVREIKEYVVRDLLGPDGAFYSAEDADSEGVEGKFYVWALDEISDLLSNEEFQVITMHYDIEAEGNFKEEATGEPTRLNVLHEAASIQDISDSLGIEQKEVLSLIASAGAKLQERRGKRVRPSRDEKILADWNGFMIAALAKAGAALGDSAFTDLAERAMEYLNDRLTNQDGRLLHYVKQDNVGIPGFLDDYAYVLWALVELYESTFRPKYLEDAKKLIDHVISHFWDSRQGGFFFTSDDSEELLARRREVYDGAIPSGNSVTMYNLVRMARLLGDPEMENKAWETVKAFSREIVEMHSAYSMMLVGLEFAAGTTFEVVLAGHEGNEELNEMIDALRSRYIPNKVVILRANKEQSAATTRLASYTKYHTPLNGRATAHVCVDHNCRLPTNELAEMLKTLGEE